MRRVKRVNSKVITNANFLISLYQFHKRLSRIFLYERHFFQLRFGFVKKFVRKICVFNVDEIEGLSPGAQGLQILPINEEKELLAYGVYDFNGFQVSILSTFYLLLFCMQVFCATFFQLPLGFVTFLTQDYWRKSCL